MKRTTVALTALLAAAMTIGVAAPAHAADEVLVSPDGVSFSNSYPGSLFGSIAMLVPGDSDQETFYVRNGGSEPGHLRITLKDVVAADADFADALTVSASTVDQAGPAATTLSADPCWVLLQGVTLGVGQTVAVTTELKLGDLHGLAGQGATASFAIGVALSSAADALPPTHCGYSDTTVPGTPAASTPQPGASADGAEVVTEVPPIDPPESSVQPDLPVLNIPDLLGIDPNTWRLFEEYFVLLLIGGFIAGTVWFALVARRRRKNDDDTMTEEPAEGAAG
jgi:hypothetical protein